MRGYTGSREPKAGLVTQLFSLIVGWSWRV